MTFTHRTLMEIFDMVPETDLNPKKNGKSRALLPFIGSLSKSFFGTATMDDVNLLANHINKLLKRDKQMSRALEQHGSHISSFMKVVNHRFDKLKKGMQLNHELINVNFTMGTNNTSSINFIQKKENGTLGKIKTITVNRFGGVTYKQLKSPKKDAPGWNTFYDAAS
ncbi:unnamed protein product [Mytilus coruscus]|uniref:Uncharacterized protein n=1 Tax=Mytilus coruscus TaxID=42192 RepID=A0A6J8A5A9_MYTCO|nr:unnamed protein product [Mytilus coruscus]